WRCVRGWKNAVWPTMRFSSRATGTSRVRTGLPDALPGHDVVMTDTDFLALMPFAASLGIQIESATKRKVVGALEWSKERTTGGGILHGGALMTLADSIGALCAFLNLPKDAGTSTTSSSTVFMGAVRGGTVT